MKQFILAMITCFSIVFAEIYEVNTLAEMDKHKSEGVLFLYDIDNTLVRLEQSFGCDQWFCYRYGQLRAQMDDRQQALDKALSEWASIQYISNPIEIESGGKEIIRAQQDEGIMVMGFTTRGLTLSKGTLIQLSKLGIDLSRTGPIQEDFFFINGQSVIYRKGVLFTSGTHKGSTLFKFLEKLNLNPKKVVFINDKYEHLAQMEETCIERGMPFVGLRYGLLDEWVESFDSKVADAQLERFLDIMPD